METIREPKSKGSYQIECRNEDCEAVVLCKRQELQCHGDAYDGYYYVLICPHCGDRTTLNSSDMKKAKQ